MKQGKYSRSPSGLRRALTGITAVLLLLALGLGGMGIHRLLGAQREQEALESLSQRLPETTEAAEKEGDSPREILPRYRELHGLNGELFGWLTVDGTRIDYPVMHTPEEPEKYLHTDFNGEYAYAGTPFLDGSNGPESQQLLIYGHNMANGSLFHDLFRYGDRAFWEDHRTVKLDTLYEQREFEIMAVLYDRVYFKNEDVFKFYQFGNAPTEAEFREAVDYYKAHSLYDTGVTAEYGDRLLALVTCAYHVEDGRFLVIAKENTPDR